MFKQKLKEILELVLEAAEKTDTYISYDYGSQSELLSVIVDKKAFLFQMIKTWKQMLTRLEML